MPVSPAKSAKSVHRRPLVTAAAAAGALAALWFVPSANASPEPATDEVRTASAPAQREPTASAHSRLHDTSGFDGTPYAVSGLGLAGVGGVLLVGTLRRGRSRRAPGRGQRHGL